MIRQPSSVTVAGPSGTGKSELVEQWLRYLNVFQVKPKKIVYAYDRWQPPVRPYAKEGWHSVSSRVTGPQSFDQMVWSDTRRSVGLGRSDGRRGTGQTRVGFVHERFLSSQHHRAVFDARFFPPLQILQDDQSQCPLHRDQTDIRTILLQAFPDRWRQVLPLFKSITSLWLFDVGCASCLG